MLEWFTTIPGLLVICGVVLLIIAIVLFIMGSKKENKGAPVNTDGNINNESITNSQVNVVETVPVTPIQPVTEAADTVVEEPGVINFTPNANPVIEPVVNSNDIDLDFTIEPEEAVEETVVSSPASEPTVSIYGGNDPLANTHTTFIQPESNPYGAQVEEPVVENKEDGIINPTVDVPTFTMPAYEEVTPTAEVALEQPQEVAVQTEEVANVEMPAVNEELTMNNSVVEEQAPIESPIFDQTPATPVFEETVVAAPAFTETPVNTEVEIPAFNVEAEPAVETPAVESTVEPEVTVEVPTFTENVEAQPAFEETVVSAPTFEPAPAEVEMPAFTVDNSADIAPAAEAEVAMPEVNVESINIENN